MIYEIIVHEKHFFKLQVVLLSCIFLREKIMLLDTYYIIIHSLNPQSYFNITYVFEKLIILKYFDYRV